VPEYIGKAGNRAKAWTEKLKLPLAPRQERVKDAGIDRVLRRIADGQYGDMPLVKAGKLPQRQPADEKVSPAAAGPAGIQTDAGLMIQPRIGQLTAAGDRPRVEERADTGERQPVRSAGDSESGQPPQIEIGKIADRVYKLMQRDLMLERERAT